MNDPIAAKQRLRREMRAVRREIAAVDGAERSRRICDELTLVAAAQQVATVMGFTAVVGEPDLTEFDRWCERAGVVVVRPDSTPHAEPPVEPRVPDLIVLPGVAFDTAGLRLGQGGGWFDRFVTERRSDCWLIGACFDEQVVDSIPTEAHDVPVDMVITDRRLIRTTWRAD